MIFYRKPNPSNQPIPMQVRRVRYLTITTLTAYPLGCVLMLLTEPDQSVIELIGAILGLGLILLAITTFFGAAATGVQRITSEMTSALDPMELGLRQRSYARAYQLLLGLSLLALSYFTLATEWYVIWQPSTFDHWSAILWGAILLGALLPTTVLAWTLPLQEIEDDEAAT